MLTESENKLIAEWLGICWHELDGEVEDDGVYRQGCIYCDADSHDAINPSFDSRDGFWLIMDHGPKRKDWEKFLDETQIGVSLEPWVFDAQGNDVSCREWAIKQDFVGEKLAVELIKFIEGGIE